MSDLLAALEEDRRAVEAFADAAVLVPDARWAASPAPGQWSPGQVTEHVVRSYEIASEVLRGTSTLRPVPRLLRPLLRRLYLARVLRRGAFPARTKTLGPFEPEEAPAPPASLLGRLRQAAERFEREAGQRPPAEATVEHPAFGPLPLADYVRFNALHTVHHRAQLDRAPPA